jgi:hypothetical protein
MDNDFKSRAAARAQWPGQLSRLDDAEAALAPHSADPSKCFAMVWRITLDAWAMTGTPLPEYTRARMPGRMVRGRGQA